MSTEQARCLRVFGYLECQRGETIADLAGWPPAHVTFRPAAGAWSAAEVLDHIVRAEAGTITDVHLGLRNPHVLGPEERPGIAALERALRSDQTFQVPAAAASIYPNARATLSDILSRWERVRAELRLIVETLTPEDALAGVFCHPFAGWMTVAEVMEHFSAHLYHHGFQLTRLRANASSLLV